MRDAMPRNGGEDLTGIDAAQEHVSAPERGYAPAVRPAAAMEHRQGPEIDRVGPEAEHQRISERVQIGAAMVIDDALGIARGAGGVEEAERVPFILGTAPLEIRIAAPEEGLVVHLAEQLATAGEF